MSRERARQVHAGFRRQNYGRLEQLIINNRSDPQVREIFQAYERLYGTGSFERDLLAFVARIPPPQSTRDWMLSRFTDRMGQAGIALLGRALPPPPAVLYTGTRRQTDRWIREFTIYITTPTGRAAVAAPVRQTARFVLSRWVDLRPGGALAALVARCGWQPQNNETFRASFSILSTNARARQVGIQQGVTYFGMIASAIRDEYNSLMADAHNYQEVYVARCHPGMRLAGGSGVVTDRQNVFHRMQAWYGLDQQALPLPILTTQEQLQVRRFDTLTSCWALSPTPGHTCQTEAQAAGITIIGVAP